MLELDEPVLAFYAQTVLPRLDRAALPAAVGQAGALYLIAPGARLELPPGLTAEPVLTQSRISLWRVTTP
jgi:hypothetical protein